MNNEELFKISKSISDAVKPVMGYSDFAKAFAKIYSPINVFENIDVKNITKAIAKQSEYMNGIHQVIQEAHKKAVKNMPSQIKILDKIYEIGWPVGTESEVTFQMINSPESFLKMDDKKLDALLVEEFCKVDNLKSEIYGISSAVPEYAEVIRMMGNILDENNWIIMYPQIFALMDRMIVYQSNDSSLENDNYTNIRSVKSFYKKLRKKDNSDDLFQYIYLKTFEKATHLWDYQSFSEPDLRLTRNAVQHGRYDPKNYTYKQFAQLVLMLSTLAMFND